MLSWLNELDRVLRGEVTKLSALRDGTVPVRLRAIGSMIIILGLLYGVCMGCFGVLRIQELSPEELYSIQLGQTKYSIPIQLVATTLKVPLLFLLTLLITFPSLYVFNALVGSRLYVAAVLRLLIAALAVNLAVLTSLGPIVAFFSICTSSYPFIVLLNVVVFGVAGLLGLVFLLQTLHRLTIGGPDAVPQHPPVGNAESMDNGGPPLGKSGQTSEHANADSPAEPMSAEVVGLPRKEPGALEKLEGHVLAKHVRTVFKVWVLIFGLVGAQMGWVLRPFIGDPRLRFSWFRERESNFFEAVFDSIRQLFLG